ncbi:Type II restriction/modification system, DNA methylase subunit YeeA [Chryseobacterium wanjuense]|uniref:site-specific DNA-methyltransferase (adenine-specific) n=1 Tax=Chryseobacterium wanjuense TaxID=356305 RepID=A0A1I0QKT7_9FLAO|nr:DNA methyltransferase [Chryseobacterium wanjuense]SEW27693.1 Type II restriction/modification system, DNA methylase subunit YeeA [Chryseobacterium wanjuense]
MKIQELKEKLTVLTKNFNKENFIFDFLISFGISKNIITRLKKGDSNLSKKEGELLYKNKIFFKEEFSGNLLDVIDEAAKDDKILKHNPRFILVSDYETIVAIDVKLKINKRFSFSELPDQADFFLPLSGAEIYKVSTNNEADRNAAYKLGQLYDILVQDNPDWVAAGSHQLNIFLSRLLFCFFAEDTDIFSVKNIFTETLVNNTNEDGSDVDQFLNTLFRKLNSKTGDFPEYLNSFPYVNGGLFKDDIISPKFSKKARNILVESGELNWSEINPDIFGSMIQAVADPEQRSNLGMHYTSVENILKLIKPLFLDELEDEFDKNMDNPKGLRKLIDRISKIKFFDPACGSGNFLIITYKEIRNLEIKIIQQIIALEKANLFGGQSFVSNIKLSQFYGIEIKDFAHEMAILSLWLAEHQMNLYFDEKLEGFGKSEPILPLKEAGNIVSGNAARINWEEVCSKNEGDEIYIIGNPPYLGARIQDEEQKSDMDFIFNSFTKYKDLDYISIWFYKGSKYIDGYNAQLAFVSTNSISQGQQIALLWDKILRNNIEISFAHTSFKWNNNAKGNAGVTVIIVGLRNVTNKQKYIFTDGVSKPAKNINAYLLDASNIIIPERMTSISGFKKMNFGNMANDGGGLILSEEERNNLISNLPLSIKFVRKLVGSTEFINGINRYCLWIDDEELEDALKFEIIKNKIEISKTHRLNSRDKGTNKLATRPHQFRDRNEAFENSIIVPRVSSERRSYIPLGFLDKDSIILDSAMAVYDAQPWLFGILHSKMHMVWVDAVGGKLETRYRYSAKLCYNTFPFPDVSEKQKLTINEYVFAILDERAKYPEKTMAWLYNPETMPKDLKHAHQNLDRAIEEIYRMGNPFTSDAERLEHLFKRYDEMTKKDTLFAKQKKTRKKKSDLS